MSRTPFRITHEEALVLDLLAERTKMDCWFRIDGNLHVHDLENPNHAIGDAAGVIMFDEGLVFDEWETDDQRKTYQDCVDRARRSRGLLPAYDLTGIKTKYEVIDRTANLSWEDTRYDIMYKRFNGLPTDHDAVLQCVWVEEATGRQQVEVVLVHGEVPDTITIKERR